MKPYGDEGKEKISGVIKYSVEERLRELVKDFPRFHLQ